MKWKGIQNCRRMEIEKKMICGLKKTKDMIINTGKEPEEVIEERVKEEIVQKTYLQVPRNGNPQIRKL